MSTQATLPDYATYLEGFSVDQVIARLDDHQDGSFNAYESCCGTHLRAGRGDVQALVHEDLQGNVNTLTYAELDAESARLAGWFQSRGLGVGDRIACMLPRSPQLLVAVLATWRIGAVYQPLFTAFGPDAVDYRLGRADTKLVITDHANRFKFDGLSQCPPVLAVGGPDAEHGDDLDWAEALGHAAMTGKPPRLSPEAPFLQMFTSGTVGKPKGVAVPLSGMPAFAIYMELAIDLRESDRFWNMADPAGPTASLRHRRAPAAGRDHALLRGRFQRRGGHGLHEAPSHHQLRRRAHRLPADESLGAVRQRP